MKASKFMAVFSAVIIMTVALMTAVATPVYAAGTTLQLSPASATVTPNSTFTVAVRLNTGTESINAVQANFKYPATMVEYVSISAVGSAFEIGAPSSGGGGKVSIARAQLGGVSSNDALVATVTFRVLAGSGSVVMAFTGGTEALSNKDSRDVLTGTSGATYTIGSGSGGATPAGNLPPVVPDPAGNSVPPSASSASGEQLPGTSSGASPSEASELTTELKNDASGATTAKVFGQPDGSKTAVWGISGLILAAALAVGAMVYLRRRRAATTFVRPHGSGYGYAQPVVVSSPSAYYGAAVAPGYPTGQATPTGRPYPVQTTYPQRQPLSPSPALGQPYQNPVSQYQSGQFHGGQIQPVIVRPTPPQPVQPGPNTGQQQQSFNPVRWGNDP